MKTIKRWMAKRLITNTQDKQLSKLMAVIRIEKKSK